jgi:hypothetical protein
VGEPSVVRPTGTSLVLARPTKPAIIDHSIRQLNLEILGHKSINVTGDHYAGWEFGQLEGNMRDLVQSDADLVAALNGRVPKQGTRRV